MNVMGWIRLAGIVVTLLLIGHFLTGCDGKTDLVYPPAVHFAEDHWCKANGSIRWIAMDTSFESSGDVSTCIKEIACGDGAVYGSSMLGCVGDERIPGVKNAKR